VSLKNCTVVKNADGTGYVVVEANKPARLFFARVFGHGPTWDVYAMTAARFAYKLGGLRPIGVCEKDTDVQTALAGWESDPNGTYTFTIPYTKDQPTPCFTGAGPGGTPGNWGFLFFGGGSQSEQQIMEWLENGYNPDSGTLEEWIPARTSAPAGNINGILDALMAKDGFPIVTFTEVRTTNPGGGGGGANLEMKASNVVGVKLLDYRVTGPQSQRFFEFQVTKVSVAGEWSSKETLGVLGVGICAVDNDPTELEVADRCGLGS
jgi:hypothetical protein